MVENPTENKDEVIQTENINAENESDLTKTTTESKDTATKKISLQQLSNKQKGILGGIVAIVLLAIIIFSMPSEFERVHDECLKIAGCMKAGDDYFMIDTWLEGDSIADQWENENGHQEKALEAIKHANERLGFNGSVYSLMMETTALMGRQSEENKKYKVSWTYHPDNGLEVTYQKK